VTLALALGTLLLAGESAAARAPAAAAPVCQSYTRSSLAAPEVVRLWLEHSRDDHVVVCEPQAAGGAEPLYTGESALTKRAGVCSYAAHFLTRTGSASRLQRYDRSEAVGMAAVGDGACPPPHEPATAQRYTMTYDLTPATFESLMAFWGAAATSAALFDRDLACCGAGEAAAAADAGSLAANAVRLRLRAAIVAGRMQAAAVTRIVRVGGLGLHRRYALLVVDPDSQPAGTSVYVIRVSRFLRGAWHISGLSDVAP
jgi:hypothetical protein